MKRLILALVFGAVAVSGRAQTTQQTLQFDFVNETLAAVAPDIMTLRVNSGVPIEFVPICTQVGANVTCSKTLVAPLAKANPGETLTVTRTSMVSGLSAAGSLLYNPASPVGPTSITIKVIITVP